MKFKQSDFIKIINAKENNLKSISVDIPKNKLVIITGVSGSGKSSLAFDVIYNEGRRRYVDSLSTYARQFLGGTSRPDVESIEGLSPSIAIDQKTTSNNPRSTVGTITEIYDFYRLLFAKIGVPFCPTHNIPITSQTNHEIMKQIFKENLNHKIQILSPIIVGQKGSHEDVLIKLKKDGFLRVKINGKILRLEDQIILSKTKKHYISIFLDRVLVNEDNEDRILEAINLAGQYSEGLIEIEDLDLDNLELYSKNFACKFGDFQIPKIETRMFSFNSPIGACNECNGLGFRKRVTWDSIVTNENFSILEGGLKYFPINSQKGLDWQQFLILLKYQKIDINKSLKDYTEKEKAVVLYGSNDIVDVELESSNGHIHKTTKQLEGIATTIERRHLSTSSQSAREWYEKFLHKTTCTACEGKRLNQQALSIKIMGQDIYEVTKMSINDAYEWIDALKLTQEQKQIAELVTKEIKARLTFLKDVGLGYLTLNRTAGTLSGGESQRIRLATQIGSKLTGVTYVLDEPSIGLHQKDNARLINSLKNIRDLGNNVIVVEHDEETMLEADHIIDIGPLAGKDGGEIIAEGTPQQIMDNPNSLTGRFLSGKETIEYSSKRRKGNGKELEIIGARENNLKHLNVKIPLKQFVAITGLSGSGKSTLINSILYLAIKKELSRNGADILPGKHSSIKGIEHINKVINISQEPIGKTPRSNPVTYTSVFDNIRDLFTETKEAKIRGYKKGRFSFNVNGGRCEKCQGDGLIKIPMHFLPDVFVKCSECDGKRYNKETLQVKYKNKSIADVLAMTVNEAIDFFQAIPQITHKLSFLEKVGLGYITLGHPSTLLSGGEAQRIKLATYLQKKPTGKTLYILDEPTTGLHNYDIKILLKILHEIVDKGDSVIVIEHNLDVIKTADYVIDLGPEGGINGGRVVAKGTPEEVAKNPKSFTGMYLKSYLK